MITAADVYRAKILIVDDKKANVLLLDRILRNAGYTFAVSYTHLTLPTSDLV